MAVTAETIIGLARDLLREEQGSDVPTIANSFMLTAVSDANMEWLRAFRRGGGNTPGTLQRETGYTLIGETNLAENVTTATTDFDVDSSSSYPSSGALAIWDEDMPDIVYYTGNAANNFTGVTGIGFSHEIDDEVQALYALPSNFKDFRRTQEYRNGVQLNGASLTYIDGPPVPGKFSTVDDGTTKYLWIYRGASGDVSVLYDKKAATIDSIDDTVDVPEEYQFFLVWKTIEKALFGRGDFGIIQVAQNESQKLLLQALKDRNIGRRVRVRPLARIHRRDYLSYSDTH